MRHFWSADGGHGIKPSITQRSSLPFSWAAKSRATIVGDMRLTTTLHNADVRESTLIALACGAFVLGLAGGLALPPLFSPSKPLDRYFGNAVWKPIRAVALEHDLAARTLLISVSDPYTFDEKRVVRLVYPHNLLAVSRVSEVQGGAMVGARLTSGLLKPGDYVLALMELSSNPGRLVISKDIIILGTRP